MTNVINAFLQPIFNIIHVVQSFFQGIIQLIVGVANSLHFFDLALQAMPPVLYAIALSFIMISVVYLIVGR